MIKNKTTKSTNEYGGAEYTTEVDYYNATNETYELFNERRARAQRVFRSEIDKLY